MVLEIESDSRDSGGLIYKVHVLGTSSLSDSVDPLGELRRWELGGHRRDSPTGDFRRLTIKLVSSHYLSTK